MTSFIEFYFTFPMVRCWSQVWWCYKVSVSLVWLLRKQGSLGFINSGSCGTGEPRGSVNSCLCLFCDWINVCYSLFTENVISSAVVVLKQIMMNSTHSSVSFPSSCLDGSKIPAYNGQGQKHGEDATSLRQKCTWSEPHAPVSDAKISPAETEVFHLSNSHVIPLTTEDS